MKALYNDLHISLYNKPCMDMLELPDESVQMVVTSPPYWGLRKYSGEQELIWGGDKDCQHQWFRVPPRRIRKAGDIVNLNSKEATVGGNLGLELPDTNTCSLCGAWKGAYGLEPTPELYIEHTIEILREIRRVLRKDGVVFLNLGDSYASGGKQPTQSPENVPACDNDGKEFLSWKECGCACSCHDDERQDYQLIYNAHNNRQPDIEPSQSDMKDHGKQPADSSLEVVDGVPLSSQESNRNASSQESQENPSVRFCSDCLQSHYLASDTSNPLGTLYHIPKLKAKDLCLIPFRVAIAAQEDGWWVRSVIIWSKNNPMPESVTDRPTESHEYILLLTKNSKYYWDADAVREEHATSRPEGSISKHFPKLGEHTNIGSTSAYNPAGRNIRSVWTFSEDDEQGDKVYKVLQGCPIHSPLLHPDILKMLSDGEPQDCLLNHTLDRYSRLVPVLSFSLLSKLYHTNEGVHLSSLGFHHHATECGQTLESIGDNRMLSLCCPDGGHKYGHQKVSHTKHIQKADGSLFCSSGYSLQSDELIATLSSKEIRKTVSLIATNDSVFLLCPDRIVHTLQSLGCICSYNNYTTSHFPLQDVWSFSTQPYKAAHFAVFPEKLPEICIKAATPEAGCCSKCGAPWERITERKRMNRTELPKDDERYRPNTYKGAYESINGKGDAGYTEVKTLGWQPTCKCNADKVPSIVLDPFAGAGTTLWVAKKLNRRAVGYEISKEYCELIIKRNCQQVIL